jgi:2,3-bisphosphoglycerate-independent phosphoglycerate mutase
MSKYGLSGSVISAVDLVKGLGLCAGLNSINVPGATGYLDTNYAGKAAAAIEALKRVDFVYVHVEAPDEASHKGSLEEKIQAIEDFDAQIVKPVLAGLEEHFTDFRLMILPDHPTPLSIKTHAADPVPFIIYSSGDSSRSEQPGRGYSEQDAAGTGVFIESGRQLMDRFIKAGS